MGRAPDAERDQISLKDLHARLDVSHVVERDWVSRTGQFEVLAATDTAAGAPVVIKRVDSWNAERTKCAYTTLKTCRAYTDDEDLPPFVTRPIGWGVSPSYIAMEWIEGARLSELMKRKDSEAEYTSWLEEISVQIGGALALFHAAFGTGDNDAEAGTTTDPENEPGGAERLARRFAGRAIAAAVPARSLGDSGPHNVVVDPGGKIWFIDLPSKAVFRPAQSEVARFAVKLIRRGETALGRSWVPHHRFQERIIDALLAGYKGSAPGRLMGEQDRALILSYLASEAIAKAQAEVKRRSSRYNVVIRETVRGARTGLSTIRTRHG